MSPKWSKKPKKGDFWGLGMLKSFLYKLIANWELGIGSLLYAISVYERFQMNPLLSDSWGGGNLTSFG